MGRRLIEVEFAGYGSLVRGYGSRDIVISVTGRPPLWSAFRRGWSVQESTARDIVAAAEALNYDVVITGRRAVERNPANTPRASAPDPGGLW